MSRTITKWTEQEMQLMRVSIHLTPLQLQVLFPYRSLKSIKGMRNRVADPHKTAVYHREVKPIEAESKKDYFKRLYNAMGNSEGGVIPASCKELKTPTIIDYNIYAWRNGYELKSAA